MFSETVLAGLPFPQSSIGLLYGPLGLICPWDLPN